MPTSTIRYYSFLTSALIVTLPLLSLAIDVGITVDFSRIFAIAALVAVLTHRSFSRFDHSSVDYILIFWGLTTVLTIGMFPLTPNHELADQSFLRNSSTRWTVQWIMLTARIASFLIAFQLARVGFASGIARTYVVIGLLLSGVGALQLLLWLLGIAEPFMISFRQLPFSFETARQAQFTAGSFKLFRLSSLGGEPKHLAASLAPLVAMMGASVSCRHLRGTDWKQVVRWILVVVVFAFTFSTGAFFGLVIGVPILLFLCGRHLTLRSSSGFAALAIVAGFSIAIGSVATSAATTDAASAVFEARVTNRFGDIDHFERAAMEFIEDQPARALVGAGVGNIPFHTYPYLEDEIASKGDLGYLSGNTLPMSSYALTTLIESGLLGFGLLLASQISILLAARAALGLATNTPGETYLLLGLTAASAICVTLQLFSFCAVQFIIHGATAGLSQRLLTRRVFTCSREPERSELGPAELVVSSPLRQA